MPDTQKARAPISIVAPAITFAAGCVGITLSIGLCGLDVTTKNGNGALIALALFLFGASLLALLISVPWFIIVLIINAMRQ